MGLEYHRKNRKERIRFKKGARTVVRALVPMKQIQ